MNLKKMMNLKKALKDIKINDKFGRNSKKYALFFALSAFAFLNTGFTAQPTSQLPAEENAAQVEETTPSEEMKLLIKEESNNLPSRITVSEDGSLSVGENEEQRLLLAEVVTNTMADIADIEDMQGLQDGEAVEEPEFIEEINNVADIDGEPSNYSSVMSMEATAYLPTDGSSTGTTATGIPATYGIVAVDPRVIPLGTRVFIPGYGEALAADTGGAIKGYKIDLCMESYAECMNFGRRNVTVYVLP